MPAEITCGEVTFPGGVVLTAGLVLPLPTIPIAMDIVPSSVMDDGVEGVRGISKKNTWGERSDLPAPVPSLPSQRLLIWHPIGPQNSFTR